MKIIALFIITFTFVFANETDISNIIDDLFYMDVIDINDLSQKPVEILHDGGNFSYTIDGVEFIFIDNTDVEYTEDVIYTEMVGHE